MFLKDISKYLSENVIYLYFDENGLIIVQSIRVNDKCNLIIKTILKLIKVKTDFNANISGGMLCFDITAVIKYI